MRILCRKGRIGCMMDFAHKVLMLRPMRPGAGGFARLMMQRGRPVVEIHAKGIGREGFRAYLLAGRKATLLGEAPCHNRGDAQLNAVISAACLENQEMQAIAVIENRKDPGPLLLGLISGPETMTAARNACLELCEGLKRPKNKEAASERLPAENTNDSPADRQGSEGEQGRRGMKEARQERTESDGPSRGVDEGGDRDASPRDVFGKDTVGRDVDEPPPGTAGMPFPETGRLCGSSADEAGQHQSRKEGDSRGRNSAGNVEGFPRDASERNAPGFGVSCQSTSGANADIPPPGTAGMPFPETGRLCGSSADEAGQHQPRKEGDSRGRNSDGNVEGFPRDASERNAPGFGVSCQSTSGANADIPIPGAAGMPFPETERMCERKISQASPENAETHLPLPMTVAYRLPSRNVFTLRRRPAAAPVQASRKKNKNQPPLPMAEIRRAVDAAGRLFLEMEGKKRTKPGKTISASPQETPGDTLLTAIDPLAFLAARERAPQPENPASATCAADSLPARHSSAGKESALSASQQRQPVDALPQLIWPRLFHTVREAFDRYPPSGRFLLPGWRFVCASHQGEGLWIGRQAQDGRVIRTAYVLRGAPEEGSEYQPLRGTDGCVYRALVQRL